MKKDTIWDIPRLTRSIEADITNISQLKALKSHGINQDIFNDDGPLFIDDNGSVNGHIEFYKSMIFETAKEIQNIIMAGE